MYRDMWALRAVLSIIVITFPLLTFAAVPLGPIVPQNTQCNSPGGCTSVCDLALLAQNIVNFSIFLAVMASAVWFMIAGFSYLTAYMRGETPGLIAAKKRLMYVALGIGIILGAWFFVYSIISILTTGSIGGMSWQRVCS